MFWNQINEKYMSSMIKPLLLLTIHESLAAHTKTALLLTVWTNTATTKPTFTLDFIKVLCLPWVMLVYTVNCCIFSWKDTLLTKVTAEKKVLWCFSIMIVSPWGGVTIHLLHQWIVLKSNDSTTSIGARQVFFQNIYRSKINLRGK